MSVDPYPQQHEMYLETTHPSGAQEWLCPTCGRRFLMHFQPKYERLDMMVLEAGDELVSHSGSLSGLHITKSEVGVVDDEPELSDEMRNALEEALKDFDLDDDSSGEDNR